MESILTQMSVEILHPDAHETLRLKIALAGAFLQSEEPHSYFGRVHCLRGTRFAFLLVDHLKFELEIELTIENRLISPLATFADH